MSYRKMVRLCSEAEHVVKARADEKGVTVTRTIETAILWWERCQRATKNRPIVAITVENPDGTEETFRVL